MPDPSAVPMWCTASSRRSSWTLWPNRAFHGRSSKRLASLFQRRTTGRRRLSSPKVELACIWGAHLLMVRWRTSNVGAEFRNPGRRSVGLLIRRTLKTENENVEGNKSQKRYTASGF